MRARCPPHDATGRRHTIHCPQSPRADPRSRSVQALDAPRARRIARENHSHACIGARRDEVGSILLHARAVVDEDEIEPRWVESWPRLREPAPGGGVDQLAVPASIRGARLFKCPVGLPDALLPVGPIRAPARDC
jgi:hypothetical protein